MNCKITFTRIAAGEEAEQSVCAKLLWKLMDESCLSMIDRRLSKGMTLLKNTLEANSNFWLDILEIHHILRVLPY